jgi:hypothetical protein
LAQQDESATIATNVPTHPAAHPKAFPQPEPCAVQDHRHEPAHTVQRVQDGLHLRLAKHGWEPLRTFGAHDIVQPAGIELKHVIVKEKKHAVAG